MIKEEMTDITKGFKRQFPRNSFFQVLSFFTHVTVGIWLVPYLIRQLGTAAYGLVPLAGVLTEYVSLISQSISIAVNRFLTIALQKNDDNEANRIFNTAFFCYAAIGLLQIPLFMFVIAHASSIITIPEELYRDAVELLTCSAAAFVINLLASVFGVPMYAYNRLDISRCLDLFRYISRLLGIVILFLTFGPALRYVGYVDVGISIVLLMAQVIVAKRLVSNLRLGMRYYDRYKIKQLIGMGGWLLVNNVGSLLFLRIDVWVCNRFVSPEAAGQYAAVLQWVNLIIGGGTIMSTLLAPMAMIYYAKSEVDRLVRLMKVSVRMLSLVIVVPISLLCAFSSSLLEFWLGMSFTNLAPLMIIMLSHLVFTIGVLPLYNVPVAMNKVRIPALATLFAGLLNLVLAILFVKCFYWGIYGVAAARVVVVTVKHALFTPVYVASVLQEPWYTFMKPYLSALGLQIGLTLSGFAVSLWVTPGSLFRIILSSLILGGAGAAAAWFVLPRGDQQLLRSLIPNRLKIVMGSKFA